MSNSKINGVNVGGVEYDLDLDLSNISYGDSNVKDTLDKHDENIADIQNALDQIQTNITKLLSYPKYYSVSGIIAGSASGTMVGKGVASVCLLSQHLARVDYQFTVSTAGSKPSEWSVGLNAASLHALDSKIPTITPLSGGTLTWYKPYDSSGNWNNLGSDMNGFGGTHSTRIGQYWTIGRNYDGSTIGTFPDSQFSLNTRIVGTCYGAY